MSYSSFLQSTVSLNTMSIFEENAHGCVPEHKSIQVLEPAPSGRTLTSFQVLEPKPNLNL